MALHSTTFSCIFFCPDPQQHKEAQLKGKRNAYIKKTLKYLNMLIVFVRNIIHVQQSAAGLEFSVHFFYQREL